ncbi:hypothetical protein BJ742DRAFT_827140, partial [Cladochytrium replicatum]
MSQIAVPSAQYSLDLNALPLGSNAVSLANATAWPVYRGNRTGGGAFTNNNLTVVTTTPISTDFPVSLRVGYPAGTYQAPSPNQFGVIGGSQFYLTPFGYPGNGTITEALLNYQVYFPADFPWNLGGTLPGIFGGTLIPNVFACSGGRASDGFNCFSVRLMWRQNGAGEAYVYVSKNNTHLCQAPNVCDEQYGMSLGRGLFKFNAGAWNNMGIYVRLNTPGQKNGLVQVSQNGNVVINTTGVLFQDANSTVTASLPPTTIMFSSFFGGSTVAWAPPRDTFTEFAGISAKIGTGEYAPIPPPGSSTTSGGRKGRATAGGVFMFMLTISWILFGSAM